MMDGRTFNAREMREMAGSIEYERAVTYFPDVFKIAQMLRQAADSLDREKKYEYASVINGVTYNFHYDDLNEALKPRLVSGEKLVRREVGDWEEMP